MVNMTDKQLMKDITQNQKYRVLIFSLVGLFMALLLIILVNFELARRITVATEHMDDIGEVSDLMFEIAADSQQLSLIDGTDSEQANQQIKQLQDRAEEVDGYLTKISEYKEQDSHLVAFNQTWQTYRGKIAELKPQAFGQVGDLAQRNELAKYAYTQKQPIYDLMAEGYDVYLNQSYQYGQYVRALQLITLLGLVGFLLFFVNYTFRRMRLADAEIQRAQQETQEIIATVNEGLFLIDKDLVIGEQYSAKLEELLNQKQIADRTLLELLDGMLTVEDMETTKLFVEQLYNNWVVEELIQDLNPLKQVLVSYVDNTGMSVTKFLTFDFLRVTDAENNIKRVFVSVVDITNELRLEKQMQQDKEQHDRQIEMISYLISVDTAQVWQFVKQSKQRVSEMNDVLKTDNNQDFVAKAKHLFRDMHSLKGDASAIKLDAVVSIAQREEAHLKKLLQQKEIRGNEFLSFTIGLNELINLIDFIEQLLQKLNFNTLARTTSETSVQSTDATTMRQPVAAQKNTDSTISINTDPNNQHWQQFFSQYAQTIAQRQGKTIQVQVNGFDQSTASEGQIARFKDIGVQLLKNAIVHGIESPESRRAAGKPEMGNVQLSLLEDDNQHKLVIRDDGQGINWQKIRQKAVNLGLVSHEQSDKLSARELVGLLFTSGLTTAEQLDEDAGQGVGMDIVRQLAVEGHGSFSLNSQPNRFTEFVIRFPKTKP